MVAERVRRVQTASTAPDFFFGGSFFDMEDFSNSFFWPFGAEMSSADWKRDRRDDFLMSAKVTRRGTRTADASRSDDLIDFGMGDVLSHFSV